jgi:hypothetical protein
MTKFVPFADEATALTISGLSIENRVDRVAVFGNAELTADRRGLEAAKQLKAVIDAVVSQLEAKPGLPDELPPDQAALTGPRDPFG